MNVFFAKLAEAGLGKEALNLGSLGQFAASTPGHALIGAGLGAVGGAVGGGPENRMRHALIGAGVGGAIGAGGRALQGESFHKPVWEGVKGVGRLINPKTTGEELNKSLKFMGNAADHNVTAMTEHLTEPAAAARSALLKRTLGGAVVGAAGGAYVGGEGHRGRGALMGAGLGAGAGALLSGPVTQLQHLGGGGKTLEELGYRSGMEGAGVSDRLRRVGLLGNFPKYDPVAAGVESVPWRAALNKVTRAIPGETAVMGGFAAHGAYSDAKAQDETGRQRGMGERVLGAGLGALTNIGTMHHGPIPMITAGMLGSMGGKYVGRGLDRMTGSGQAPPLPVEQVPE